MKFSTFNFLGHIWFGCLLLMAKLAILHCVYQRYANATGNGARGIEGRENQQKEFTDIDLV